MQKCEQPEDKQFISKQEKAVFLAKFAFQQIFVEKSEESEEFLILFLIFFKNLTIFSTV